MAHGISGGNYFANVNAQFAKDLQKSDGQAATVARNNSGQAAQQRRGMTPKNKVPGGEDSTGIALSDKAREALKSDSQMHADQVAEHGHELAQQAGLQQTADSDENAQLRSEYGYERAQEALAEGETPPGFVRVDTPEGEPQLLTTQEYAQLEQMDDPDFTDARVLDDIPEANLEAASATLDTQMAAGVSKVANLRTDPKIDAIAEQLEIEPTPVLSEPMDIMGPGTDKLSGPMPLDFPPEMEQVAAEKAARDLAAGGEQELFVAGAGAEAVSASMARGASGPSVTAPPVEARDIQPGEDIGEVAAPQASASAGPAQAAESPQAPPYLNQPGQVQQPVQPSFWQRLKYMFTGNPEHLGGAVPPYPAGMYQSPMNYGGYAMDASSYLQAAAYGSAMSWSNPYMSLMGMGSMFSPFSMPSSYYMSTMPMNYGAYPLQFSPQPYGFNNPYGVQQGYGMSGDFGMNAGFSQPGYGVPGYGVPGYGVPGYGVPAYGQTAAAPGAGPLPGMQGPAPAQFSRYDPTPQKPGAVVILDTFQPTRDGASPLGEVATYALGQPRGEVARCELARPAAPSGWLTQVQQAPPEQIRSQLLQDMASNRLRLLDGATQNLNGLAQEGLKNSAVSLPNGPSAATDVYATYGGLSMAWTQQGQNAGQPSGAVAALANYCKALGLDMSRVMSPDPAVSGPERTRLQQGLVDLSGQVDQNPQVQQSQKAYADAVGRLAQQKVSVVVAGDVSGEGLEKMAADRGGRELKTPENFQRSFFSVPGTVTVGASYRDESGATKPFNKPGHCDILADCSIRDANNQVTNLYGATVAAPRVASTLASLHAKHPDKSTAEVFELLKTQGSEAVAGTPQPVMTAAAARLIE